MYCICTSGHTFVWLDADLYGWIEWKEKKSVNSQCGNEACSLEGRHAIACFKWGLNLAQSNIKWKDLSSFHQAQVFKMIHLLVWSCLRWEAKKKREDILRRVEKGWAEHSGSPEAGEGCSGARSLQECQGTRAPAAGVPGHQHQCSRSARAPRSNVPIRPQATAGAFSYRRQFCANTW